MSYRRADGPSHCVLDGGGKESLRTHHWREEDSNRRSPVRGTRSSRLLLSISRHTPRPTHVALETCATLGVGTITSFTLDIPSSDDPGCSLTRRDDGACSGAAAPPRGGRSAQIVPVGMPADGHGRRPYTRRSRPSRAHHGFRRHRVSRSPDRPTSA